MHTRKSFCLYRSLLVTSGIGMLIAFPAWAAIIGSMTPPASLSLSRIQSLPAAQQPVWLAYLKRSDTQRAIDRAVLASERLNLSDIPAPAADGNGEKSMPLGQPDDFYRQAGARHIADVILSFQTPAGGWGKNHPRTGELRKKGQAFISHDKRGDQANNDPKAEHWAYVGTLDNGATITELRFLARVAAVTPGADGDVYREAARRGLRYLLQAQYPNGGWPQVWPLDGGYHDAITFNDDALIDTIAVLGEAVSRPEFAFVEPALRSQIRAAVLQAHALILRTQIKVSGAPTIWAQQYDVLTEAPCGARNFEPPALTSLESANVVLYLMALNQPSPEVRNAIRTATEYFKASAIHGMVWLTDTRSPSGRKLEPRPGAGPLWARYYDVQTGTPIFGDRDRSIHDEVNEISLERRNGYGWFNTAPLTVLRRAP